MEMDREWFETFFEVLTACLLPAALGSLVFFGRKESEVEKSGFRLWPTSLDAIGAAVIRLSGFVVVFAWVWALMHPYYVGRVCMRSAPAAFLIPLLCSVMGALFFGAILFWRRDDSLAKMALVWLVLVVVLALLSP